MCICVSWNNNIYWYEVTGVRWALVFCCVVHAWPFFGCLALLHALGLITKSALPCLTLRCVSLREIDPNSLCFAASCAHPWLAFFFSATAPLSSPLFSPPSRSVQEYLGGALVQVGLCKAPNPIASIRMNARFAFLEMRSAEDATSALNLDGIPFGGAALSVGRPKKVTYARTDDMVTRYINVYFEVYLYVDVFQVYR